jgi:hypothetical protein
MSTFIYTLQRKIQELQNLKASLIKENNNLRSNLQYLTEADTDGTRGLMTSTQPDAEMETYQSRGGFGDYITRTTDRPQSYYTGFTISNVPFQMPEMWQNYQGLLIPQGWFNSSGNWVAVNPTMLAQLFAINVLNNPSFNPSNFQSFNQMYSAFKTQLYNSLNGHPNLNQVLSTLQSSPFRSWMGNAWESTGNTQSQSYGNWNMSQNWPY